MMDISQKKDIIVFILIVFLALLIGYNKIYKGNLNRINLIKLQIEEKEKKKEILGIIDILDKKLQIYRKRSFSTAEMTLLSDKVSQLMKAAKIEIETFNPLAVIDTDVYTELRLKLAFSCKYHKLGQLLSLIESNQEFLWAKRLDMEKFTVTEFGEIKIPRINLEVSGFYLKE